MIMNAVMFTIIKIDFPTILLTQYPLILLLLEASRSNPRTAHNIGFILDVTHPASQKNEVPEAR